MNSMQYTVANIADGKRAIFSCMKIVQIFYISRRGTEKRRQHIFQAVYKAWKGRKIEAKIWIQNTIHSYIGRHPKKVAAFNAQL